MIKIGKTVENLWYIMRKKVFGECDADRHIENKSETE